MNIAQYTSLAFLIPASLLLTACDSQKEASTAPAAEEKLDKSSPQETKKRQEDLLSHHDTKAIFTGTEKTICLGRSMLCPDRCGHSGTLANFKIINYIDYTQASEYGDPKAETFSVMLESTTDTSEVSPEIAKFIRQLKPNTKVHLAWDHLYVKEGGLHTPVRKITHLSAEN